jgi:pre-mRNA-splicing helicase BRR2
MAENFQLFRRFEYRTNSNLVLQREGAAPSQNEPTGEPESLRGNLYYRMGDLVRGGGEKDTDFQQLKDKAQKKRVAEAGKVSGGDGEEKKTKRARLAERGDHVLSNEVTEIQSYRPRTVPTQVVYSKILALLAQQLGDQMGEVLRGAADEVIATLKTDAVSDMKKRNVEEVLGPISDEFYNDLLNLSKQITDFGAEIEETAEAGGVDEAAGVAVVFDEEDDENEDQYVPDLGEESDEDEDDKLDGVQREDQHAIGTGQIVDDEEEMIDRDALKYEIEAAKVDAHWLQRELQKLTNDAQKAVALEKEILAILPFQSLQECENKLVQVLQYENFEFAKLLLRNRWKIYFLTRLGQAQSDEAKSHIQEEMADHAEGPGILEELERGRMKKNKEKEFARDVRKEARALAKAGDRAAAKDVEEGVGRGKEGADTEMKKPSHMLDLSSLEFTKGGHLMSNSKCNLPEGTFRTTAKGYEAIHVKPYKPPPVKAGDLVSVEDLPEWARPCFPGVKKFNPVQSKVFKVAFKEDEENMLVCAPTGSGKTNCAMLTIMNVVKRYIKDDGSVDLNGFKIVYVAPMKALVQEVVQSFGQKLSPLNIKVRELSGDNSLSREQIDDTQIIVTTPEKWDVITRKAGDQRAYTQLLRLLIIDEVHLLHDSRGPVIEALVARSIRQMEQTQEAIRIVALSATLPNYTDVAIFLRVNPEKGLFVFGNHFRPVPMELTFIGITERKAIKRHSTMNEILYEKVMENAGKNQVLIFVHSRKETVKTARQLREMALEKDTLSKFLQEDSASREILQTECEALKTNDLKEMIPFGIGVHHAGLPKTDRKLIEDLFADKHIQVLVSTATLAWGVNLPAHTVIIKGTQVYMPEKGAWTELSGLDVMQMLGRAGRPQYDTKGHGVIITQHSELQYYLSLTNQQLPIESQLIKMLPDFVNAELVLGTIHSRQDAVNWLGYTYLMVRMMRNPTLYGIAEDALEDDKLLEQHRVDLVHSALTILDRCNCVKYDKRTGAVQVTALGRVASYFYIRHQSIAVYNEHMKPTMSDIELLRLFALSNEFKYIPVRDEEKVEMQRLLERVPIPVKGAADETASKVNVLLQAYISKLKLDGFAMVADMVYIQQSAGRIFRAIFEICLKRGWAALALRSLQFCKMVDKRMWPSQTPLRHFRGLAEDILKKIEKKDFAWSRYYDLNSAELGELVRFPKMGKTIHKLVHQFPKLELSAYVQPITRSCLLVELTITPDFQWDPKVHGTSEPFWILVEDVNGEVVLHHEYFVLKESGAEDEHTVTFTVAITEPLPPQYFLRVVSDRWVNAETLLTVSFRHLILPEKYPPHTELLDLQPLPLSALRYPEAEAIYTAQQKVFNPIQTQVFSHLYSTDDNVLICAPAASGKIQCAEFAIWRMLRNEEPARQRAVYLAPFDRLASERLQDWQLKFGKRMGLTVRELTGDSALDVKILETTHITITTPEKWDLLSRRWKTRKPVQEVRLFIVDELHLIDSEAGPTLETVVSRMRYISVQLESPIRIVGMAASLANAKDVSEWLGAPPSGLFNFHPNVRSVPLEIVIQGFDVANRSTRLLAMARPCYQAIKAYSPEKPVIIFAPDRKQARLTAIDLLLQAAADDKPRRFVQVEESVMAPHVAAVRESALQQTLAYGVAYYHEGMSESERGMLARLFEAGAIQVLVATESLAWGMTLQAKLVVIMDTKRFDGREQREVDYPMHDVLQMLGRASRPGLDVSGVCVLLCQSSKKEYYKKFIYEPLPVESHLDQRLTDHMNAEIVMKTIENKQDAVDWLTWTFYYRRLSQNPNYYGLQGVTHQHVSDHLSEAVESAVDTLQQYGRIAVEDQNDLSAANLGLIAAYYYIRSPTIELFAKSVQAGTKRKGLLEVISAASEFDQVPVRMGEEGALRGLAQSLGIREAKGEKLNEPHTKALILLHAHFHRLPLSTDLAHDQHIVLAEVVRILQGLVDVVSSNGWLTPALLAMELSQMSVQAMTNTSSPLLQLPHFTSALVEKAKSDGLEDVFDVMNAEEDVRNKLLEGLTDAQKADIARACNRYPCISMSWKVSNEDSLQAGGTARLQIKLERDAVDEGPVGPVVAPYYPKEKEESWWLVVGTGSGNSAQLLAIKRITMSNKPTVNVKLDVELPQESGKLQCTLYFMSDSYMGCDQEYKLDLKIK